MDNIFSIIVVFLLAAAAAIDVTKRIIPNGICAAVLVLGLIKIGHGAPVNTQLIGIIAAALMCGIVYAVSKKNFGMGDIKLLCALGFFFGFAEIIEIVLLASICALLFSIVLLSTGKVAKEDSMPFAPFILIGTIGGIII